MLGTMKPNDPQLKEILAGEYVLGTLHGSARERFERELGRDEELQRLVSYWGSKLHPLAEALPPVEPPSVVWRKIEARLMPSGVERVPWYSRVNFLRPFAMAAPAGAIFAFIYFGVITPQGPVPHMHHSMAVLADKQNAAGWMIAVNPSSKEMMAMAMHPAPMKPDQSYELWILPGKNKAPISLGLLPMKGSMKMKVEGPMLEKLMGASGLAVSLEPAGGSPTRAPTRPGPDQGSPFVLGKA